jgi:selenocysteine-specific elongation factor
MVLDAAPLKHSVTSREVAEKLGTLRSADPLEAAAVFVAEAGTGGLPGAELARRLGIDNRALEPIVSQLVEEDRAVRVSENPVLLLSPEIAGKIGERILEELRRFQKAHPLREGMPRGELREKATGRAPVEVFESMLSGLVQGGKARAEREWVATADHRIQLSSEEADARAFLTEIYRKAGYQPSTLADIAAKGRKDPKLLTRIERLLLQEGTLVKVAEGLVFHREVLEELKQAIGRRKEKSDRIDVAFFKELAGVTRKYAIPLLEWLDREHVTRRVGNERVIL